ncbi:MAG TPA: bifunctional metallophosphatase/5'-nucleotidase [Myxococcaceae bacterium]|nr:bifunctional metallophosphatase/5'-nucleotidase [Myxococcaceae bacterium]
MHRSLLSFGWALALALMPAAALAKRDQCQQEHADLDDREARTWTHATARLNPARSSTECDPSAGATQGCVRAQILGFNDFHGRLNTGLRVSGRLAGGAAVVASYLRAASKGEEDSTIIAVAGDHVGASPLYSALLQDEPAIQFLNLLGNEHCRGLTAASENGGSSADDFGKWMHPRCNLVASVGNHEFDEGKSELLRLAAGGNFLGGPFGVGPFLEDPWSGARYPLLASNVLDVAARETVLPPYAVKVVNGVRIGFIGSVLKETPTIVLPSGVAGLQFMDEAAEANRWARELKNKDVKALVLVIHQGGFQSGSSLAGTPIAAIASQLDPEFDVIVAGHTHSFNNALLPTAGGGEVLVAQAFANSTAYSDIDLLIDPESQEVVKASARIVTTFAECPLSGPCPPEVVPGLPAQVAANAPDVVELVNAALNHPNVVRIANRVVARLTGPITRDQNSARESALGNLIADAQREVMGTEIAFMNPGGVRQDLVPDDSGTVVYRQIFDVQPFGNSLVKMTLTGAQLRRLLESQFSPPNTALRILHVSGLRYGWRFVSGSSGPGEILGIFVANPDGTSARLVDAQSYTVTANSFIADGGDNFLVLKEGTNRVGGPVDLDALEAYLAPSITGAPISPPALGRITLCPAGSTLDVCTR